MKRAWLVMVAISCGCGSSQAPVQPAPTRPPADNPAPPAEAAAFDPPAPTLRLPRHFTPTRYTARLAVDPALPTFDGAIEIEGNLDRRSAVIWLHAKQLAISSAKASDGTHEVTLAVKAHGDLLELRPSRALDPGRWTLSIAYRGQIQATSPEGAFLAKYGTDAYIATQLEAIAARLVFPCLDEPDRKTPWQLTLDVPKGLVAVSNTMPTGTVALDATHERIAFAATRPLPSYLVAFAVGPFEVLDAGKGKSGVVLRVITPRGTAKKVAFLTSAMPKMVDALEAWFEMPYPYPKLDVLVAPLEPSAMENAGLIITSPKYVLFDNPGPRERYECVSVIGHETAHQWFGDLVTAAWWDDIWLNESFATWTEDKVLAAFDPSWPLEAFQHRAVGFAADQLLSSRKIRQPIETLGDISNAFDGVTYPKGSTVLRMIEHHMGEAAFQSAIQHYLTSHADGNATAADLFAALDGAGKPLGKLVSSWFDQPGVPEVAMTLTCDGKDKARVALTQKRYLPGTAGGDSHEVWTIPVCVAYEGAKHERVEQCTVLDAKQGELALPTCPTWFAPAGDYGYYRTKLDAKALDAIRDKAWKSLSRDEHLSIYNDAYAFAVQGSLPFQSWTSLTTLLGHSRDPLEVSAALGDVWLTGGGALGYPTELVQALPAPLLAAARAKVRAIAEPLARKYGLVPAANDTVVTAMVRSDLLGAIVWSHSHVLDAQAKKLVARYHELSVDTMSAVLAIAANADPKIATSLRADLDKEVDPVVRGVILGALGNLGEPERYRTMLASIATDPALTTEEYVAIWYTFADQDLRAVLEAYEREHLAEIEKRIPVSDTAIFPFGIAPAISITGACDPTRRDEIATYVTSHFASLPAAARPIKQFIEMMDDCIARKKLLEPALRTWLTGKP
ncbi:MAG: M1 family metallopeptidase [Deltaproteobacteria bacterium]